MYHHNFRTFHAQCFFFLFLSLWKYLIRYPYLVQWRSEVLALYLKKSKFRVQSALFLCLVEICFYNIWNSTQQAGSDHILWGFRYFRKLHKNKVNIFDCVVLQESSILTLHRLFVHCFRAFCTVFYVTYANLSSDILSYSSTRCDILNISTCFLFQLHTFCTLLSFYPE